MARPIAGWHHEPSPLELTAEAVAAADRLLAAAIESVRALVAPGGRIERGALEREQYAVHGLAWWAVHVGAVRQMDAWARRLEAAGRLGELERLMLGAAFDGYLARLAGGVPMSQTGITRPQDLGLDDPVRDAF